METIRIMLQVPPPSQPEYAGKCYRRRREGDEVVGMSYDEAMGELEQLRAEGWQINHDPQGVMYPNYTCTRH